MIPKHSDIWRELLFNYWCAKGKPLFPNPSCSYGAICGACTLRDRIRKYLLQRAGSGQLQLWEP